MFDFKKIKMDKNTILVIVAILAIVITGLLLFANTSGSNVLSFLKLAPNMSKEQIAQKSIDYINKNVLQGQTATLGTVSEESGIIKIQVKIGANSYDSYVTKDGKLFFPQAFNLDSKTTASTQTQNSQASITPANVAKVASTMLEAYVVSDCPYGLQMQRAMAEAVKNIPALADYIKVRYIGSVSGNSILSMHDSDASGKQVANGLEAKENLKQICLREEQPAKYWNYVSCYMQKAAGSLPNTMPIGDSAQCSVTAGVDTAKLNSCISDPARGLAYAKADFALDTKYGVSGSPTLVLNGATISEDAFGGRAADAIRNIVCSSSKTAPSFCSTKLNTAPAATSFSLTYAGGAASSNSAANCAPAAR